MLCDNHFHIPCVQTVAALLWPCMVWRPSQPAEMKNSFRQHKKDRSNVMILSNDLTLFSFRINGTDGEVLCLSFALILHFSPAISVEWVFYSVLWKKNCDNPLRAWLFLARRPLRQTSDIAHNQSRSALTTYYPGYCNTIFLSCFCHALEKNRVCLEF